MALHVVLGFRSLSADSAVDALYAGRDADEARKAIATYKGAATKWVRNPSGVRKVNDQLARSRDHEKFIAGLAARPQAEPLSAEEQEKLQREHEVGVLESENEELRKTLSELEKSAAAQPAELELDAEPAEKDTPPPKEEPVKEEAPSPSSDEGVDPEAEERKAAARKQAEAARKVVAAKKSDSGRKK
jgi:hypothetical protein